MASAKPLYHTPNRVQQSPSAGSSTHVSSHSQSQSKARGKVRSRVKNKSSAMPAFLQAKLKNEDEETANDLQSEAHKLGAVAQLKLKVGASHDKYEKEADQVASSVLSGTQRNSTISSLPASPSSINRSSQQEQSAENVSNINESQIKNVRSDTPLPDSVRQSIEPVIGYSLENVRIIESPQAKQTVDTLGAKAFTHGNIIWLGKGQSKYDTGLMAHEATHVIQQGAQQPLNSSRAAKYPAQQIAPSPSMSAQKASSSGIVQRSFLSGVASVAGSAWNATGGKAVNVVKDVGAKAIWGIINRVAPSFAPVLKAIKQQGIIGYLYQLLKQGIASFFSGLGIAPKNITRIFSVFENMGGQLSEILVALSNGQCGPLFAALKRLKNILTTMAGNAWNSITEFFAPVGEMFSTIWGKIGAPLVKLLGSAASSVFTFLKKLASKLWSWTSPIRKASSRAWNWVKDKLGLNSSGSSGNGSSESGIGAWITDKISSVWNRIKLELKPITDPIVKTIRRIKEFLPIDAIINLRNKITDWIGQITSLSENMSESDGVTKNQALLRQKILPAVLARISALQVRFVLAGLWLSIKIGGLLSSVQGFISGLSKISILSFAKSSLNWLETAILRLSVWAQTTVQNLFIGAGRILHKLTQFILPVLNVLRKLANVIKDIAGNLGELVTGTLFKIIPKCILIPIKNFIKNQILSRIPIFSQLFSLPDVWVKVKATAMQILKQIFIHGNLAKAAWTFFSAILSIFNIPSALIKGILKNALSAIGDILRNPISFLINLLRTIKLGFGQFFKRIFKHLFAGVSNWLFSSLAGTGITPPKTFDFPSILKVVMQILDITRERIFQRLADRIGKPAVDKLRKKMDLATGAWKWFASLIKEGPAGLWKVLKQKLSGLWDTVLNGLVSWLQTNIITRISKKLLTMLDPSGIMAVVNSVIALYKAIESFMAYLRQMLEIVAKIFSGIAGIAKGAIVQAAGFLENALAGAIPIVIGFLANQLSLGNLGEKIKEMVQGVRSRVDKAINWLITKALRLGGGLVKHLKQGAGKVKSGVKKGIKKLQSWWLRKSIFTTKNGDKHRIYIKGKTAAARLMMKSKPTPYMDFINTLDGSEANISQAKKLAAQVDILIQSAATNNSENEVIEESQKIQALLDELANLTAPMIKGAPGKQALQGKNKPSKITSKVSVLNATQSLKGSTVGMTMTASYLGPDHNTGSATKGNQPSLMDKLVTSPKRYNDGKFIRGHLLNHDLGGRGEDNNLFPITAEANKKHNIYVEEPLKELVNVKKFWVFYSVNVKVSDILLNKTERNKNKVKAQFICKANKIAEDGSHLPESIIKQSVIDSIYIEDTRDITDDSPAQELFVLNNASFEQLKTLNTIDSKKAQKILDYKQKHQAYTRWQQVMTAMEIPINKHSDVTRKIKNTQGKTVQLHSKKQA